VRAEIKMNEEDLIGLSTEAAIELLKSNGFKARIMEEDGQVFIGTCDYCLDRFNLNIVKGIVIAASKG
jgi:hypothetical protein